MIPFQIVFTLGALSIAIYQIARGILGTTQRPSRFLFAAGLTASVAAVLNPDWMQKTADLLVIGRGADLVLYLFFFFLYRSYRELYEQMAILARRLTLLEADRRVHLPQDKLNDPVGPQTGEPAQSDK